MNLCCTNSGRGESNRGESPVGRRKVPTTATQKNKRPSSRNTEITRWTELSLLWKSLTRKQKNAQWLLPLGLTFGEISRHSSFYTSYAQPCRVNQVIFVPTLVDRLQPLNPYIMFKSEREKLKRIIQRDAAQHTSRNLQEQHLQLGQE